jgi:hypothetical protein
VDSRYHELATSITIALVLHPPDLRNFDHLTVEEPQDEGLRMYKSQEVRLSSAYFVPLPALDADIPSSSPPRCGQVTVHLLAQK